MVEKTKYHIKNVSSCLRCKSWWISKHQMETDLVNKWRTCDLNWRAENIRSVWSDEEAVTFLTLIHEQKCRVSVRFFTWFSIVWALTGALLMTSSCCVLFFCRGSVAATGELAPPAGNLSETPRIYIMLVDGNKFAFSFADILKIQLRFVLH